MDDEVDRLRLMLGGVDVREQPELADKFEPFMVPEIDPNANTEYFTDSEDDEKILNIQHATGGRLEQPIGPAECKDAVHIQLERTNWKYSHSNDRSSLVADLWP
jgi:hypothetical protein